MVRRYLSELNVYDVTRARHRNTPCLEHSRVRSLATSIAFWILDYMMRSASPLQPELHTRNLSFTTVHNGQDYTAVLQLIDFVVCVANAVAR